MYDHSEYEGGKSKERYPSVKDVQNSDLNMNFASNGTAYEDL